MLIAIASSPAYAQVANSGTFGSDLAFLKKHKKVVVLQGDNDACQVAIVPDYQGRVMTSTANGADGMSYGWINYDLISSGKTVEHINVFGGEDRFWMGPEGGQYSIFFKNGKDFTFENWFTPAAIDTEPFELVRQDQTSASFLKKMKLPNYSGYLFDVEVKREISILEKAAVEANLNIKLGPNTKYVGFQSVNDLKNTGQTAWRRESGLLSIWILGMFNPSDETSIIIPYQNELKLNSGYFGEVPKDRLMTTDKAVVFKGDGKLRSKIGLPPNNIVPVCGSYDAENNVLTIVQYTFGGEADYVNSFWKLQDEPYAGDVVNSYNDGPLDDGSQLGPFYELESSSSARALQPNQSIRHTHKTYHFEGTRDELDRIAKSVLGLRLRDAEFASSNAADSGKFNKQSKLQVPKQENQFTWVYKPSGDKFYGPDTKSLKAGKWYDDWVPNDHAFIKGDDRKWHIFGITHPYVSPDPKFGDIHQGEYASFHAVSSATSFAEACKKHHFSDLPKVLPPSERPDEPVSNHAPFVVKKDGLFYMVYGPSPIRLAVSKDLKNWESRGNLFSQEDGARDPNLLLHEGVYYISYCSQRSVLTRMSKDLRHWSEPKTIFTADSFDPESPTLIHFNDTFYLFVCSWDGEWDRKELQGAYQHKTYVYQSDDLLSFGIGDEKEVAQLNSHAPEVFQDEQGQWYISSVEWPNRGVSIDRLNWEHTGKEK